MAAPLAFLQRMDRIWHWLLLTLFAMVAIELTYALAFYNPANTFVLPLVAGTVFALTLRSKPVTVILVAVLMLFRLILWFNSLGIEMPLATAVLATFRNIAAPYITARFVKRRLQGGLINRPSHVGEHYAVMFTLSLILVLPILYIHREAIGGMDWLYRSVLEANASTLSVLLLGVLISRCIVGRSLDLELSRPLAYIATVTVILMPATIWILFPEASALDRLALLIAMPALLYLAAGFSIVWVLGALILHSISVWFATTLGRSPFTIGDPLIDTFTLHSYIVFVVGSMWLVSLYSREQKKANQALNLMKDHLEELVVERTRMLQESNRKLQKENDWRSKAEALLRRLTLADPVTELPNRAGIMAIYESNKQEMDRNYSVVVISLENFREVVESEGYSGGDLLIRQLADSLKDHFKGFQYLGRWDDSHLVLLYRNTSGSDPELPLPELMVELEAFFRRPMFLGNTEIQLKALMVASPLSLAYTTTIDPLERMLLWINQQFVRLRNSMDVQWAIMNDPPETAGHSHFQLLNRIRSGIEGNEFVMHYQPVISGSGDRIIGCESLIRWQDSSNGRLLGPNAFIPVAEKDPVILDLGNWIFQHVAEQAARWKSEGLILDFYSINVAVPQLLQGSFAHRALRLWEKSGLSPEHLKIEITESLLAQKGETLEQNLSTLRSHGVSIAFDDFGTGYSSLAYLDSFPVDCIKVDRVFVQRSASSAAHASIIEAVGLMARQMDLTVIIEGIEDESNLSRIRSVTDVYGWQGYYFSPPLKSEDLPLFVYDFNPARAVQASS